MPPLLTKLGTRYHRHISHQFINQKMRLPLGLLHTGPASLGGAAAGQALCSATRPEASVAKPPICSAATSPHRVLAAIPASPAALHPIPFQSITAKIEFDCRRARWAPAPGCAAGPQLGKHELGNWATVAEPCTCPAKPRRMTCCALPRKARNIPFLFRHVTKTWLGRRWARTRRQLGPAAPVAKPRSCPTAAPLHDMLGSAAQARGQLALFSLRSLGSLGTGPVSHSCRR